MTSPNDSGAEESLEAGTSSYDVSPQVRRRNWITALLIMLFYAATVAGTILLRLSKT